MFDKFKARVEKLEETNETFRTAKAHVVKYQVVYAMVGTAIITTVVIRSTMSRPQITHIVNTAAPVFNNLPVFNNTVNNGGPMRKIVKCLETGQLWESVTDAAEAAETTLHYMSRHLNGWKDNVHGKHYVIEALAAG